MAVINHAKREVNAKIIYFGPPGCGKGELFRFIHQRIKPSLCGPLKSMPAGHDMLLFFDYIPFETSSLDGYRIRFHLYTLTGPVTNPGTWKMTLKGVDGLAFVTAGATMDDASESLRVLRSMLNGYGRDLRSLPRLWLPGEMTAVSAADTDLLTSFDPSRTVACSPTSGDGVLQSLAQLSQEVLQRLRNEHTSEVEPVVCAPLADDGVTVVLAADDAAGPTGESIITPELKIALTGNSSIQVPLSIQSGTTVKRCVLRLTVQLDEECL